MHIERLEEREDGIRIRAEGPEVRMRPLKQYEVKK